LSYQSQRNYMPHLDTFQIALPNGESVIIVDIHSLAFVPQKQMLLQPRDVKLQLDSPMLIWADCNLIGKEKLVAVGWSQTMLTMIVEFCYADGTYGCIAELDLTPCPCADGGWGIWYGGTNTCALQFLGEAYDRHEIDQVYFDLVNSDVLMMGGTEFVPDPYNKRAILSDSPFVRIPEDAVCTVANPNLPVSQIGAPFRMGHGSPVRTTDNANLFAGSQLECVKARYRFETYFCALLAEDASIVPDVNRAPAFAKIKWGLDFAANITGTFIHREWYRIGPVRIRETGARQTEYNRLDGSRIVRKHGVPCNQGNRGVVFDYRLLNSFW
jgi:hypothetical protein